MGIYFVLNQDCVVQYLRQKLKFILGEWSRMSPWEPLFHAVKNLNIQLINSMMQLEVMDTPGIVEMPVLSPLDTTVRQLQMFYSSG